MNERNYLFFEYLFLWTGIIYLFLGMFILIILRYEGGFVIDFLFIFFLFCILISAIFYTQRIKWVKQMQDEIKRLKEGLNDKDNRS